MKPPGIELQHRLDLALTPQLILNLKLLPLATLELEQIVRHELETNPALELTEDGGAAPESPESPPEAPADSEDEQQVVESNEARAESGDGLGVSVPDDYSISDLQPDDTYVGGAVSGGGDDEPAAVEIAAGPEQSLRDALLPGLRAVLSSEDAMLAADIIEWLNEDGFLAVTVDELAATLGADIERVKAILRAIQQIPPGGIGCSNAREALLVQLELAEYGPDTIEHKLLADHWDLLCRKQTGRIARLCGVDENAVRAAVGRILSLEPKPARRFTGEVTTYVSPDFSVVLQGNRLVAIPADEFFPRLRLSRRYAEMLRSPTGVPKEQLEFARRKFNGALMFLRAIESRRQTVKKLVELIIRDQREFFIGGPEFLKPATLRDAAGELGVHPSTASRAIAAKYLETDFGIFPLKYFFRAGKSDRSRTSIKEKIEAIIESEDRTQPYSDDEICEKLKVQGIVISRRTVAKYRSEMNVAGCHERRSF